MRTHTTRSVHRHSRPVIDDDYFERKAQELIAPDDEIEAWELDAQDLDGLGDHRDSFNAPGSE